MPRRMRSCVGRSVMSSPKKRMRPAVGMKSPVMALNSVVLPAPLEPRTARRSPAAILMLMPVSATSAPKCLRDAFELERMRARALETCRGKTFGHWLLLRRRRYGQLGLSRPTTPSFRNSSSAMPSVWLTCGTTLTSLL